MFSVCLRMMNEHETKDKREIKLNILSNYY